MCHIGIFENFVIQVDRLIHMFNMLKKQSSKPGHVKNSKNGFLKLCSN